MNYGYIQMTASAPVDKEFFLRSCAVEGPNLFVDAEYDVDRPKFNQLLNLLQKGDTLYVEALPHLAGNEEYRSVMDELKKREVTLVIRNVLMSFPPDADFEKIDASYVTLAKTCKDVESLLADTAE